MNKKYLVLGIICSFLCVYCIVSSIFGFDFFLPRTKEEKLEDSVRDSIVETIPETSITTEKEDETSQATETMYISPIDFAELQNENPDIYAWLDIPGTNISYPVLQREGNDSYYLNNDSDGNSSVYGALFTESKYNSSDFSDITTVIYGHHIMTGEMFGNLQTDYSDADEMEAHKNIFVYTPDREYHFQVFAAVPFENWDIMESVDFSNSFQYGLFLDEVYSKRDLEAVFDDNMKVTDDDRLLILSTCLVGNRNKRFIVISKLLDDG